VYLLESHQITKRFGGLVALNKVDFFIKPGEILGLIGPNGAGKTTLFNVITGVYAPSSGMILFRGIPISGLKPHQICQLGISRTYQLVRPFPSLTALQNVLVGIYFGRDKKSTSQRNEGEWEKEETGVRHPSYPFRMGKDAEREALELLDFFGLSHKANVLARNLTMTERKRLEIARALGTHPQLLLLDEVMAGLTPSEISSTMSLIRQIRERGITICLIEHIMKAIMELSDRVVVLHHGEKIAEGTPEEVAHDPGVVAAYLGE
jgi:branched-chain amino acid transport system ATP-binding protein